MGKKKIIAIACGVYVLILLIGGAVYFSLSQQTAQNAAEQSTETVSQTAKTEKNNAAEEKVRDQKEKELLANLTVEDHGALTLYTNDYPKKPSPGVYLRPFVATDGSRYVLKFDLYYYYNIKDGEQTAWIHGDTLDVDIDGTRQTLDFVPQERWDKMSQDAENLAENYVQDATPTELTILKRIGQAKSVTLHYYQKESGEGRSQQLTQEEMTKIRNMVAFYKLKQQDTEG